VAADFAAMLTGLREVARSFYGGGVDTYHPLTVRPSLQWALVPKPKEKEDRDPDRPRVMTGPRVRRSFIGPACRAMAVAVREAAAGFIDGGKSDGNPSEPRRRHGFHGLTTAGARTIEDFCALTRDRKHCYGIWTVTLPPETAEELDRIPDGFAKFQDVIRRRFGEALADACARETRRTAVPTPDHWAFVVEPQKSGRPHLHFVFRSKSRRGRPWLLGKGRLDRLIRNAFRTATGHKHRTVASGNVQALRKDPGSYLSKYLAKGLPQNSAEYISEHGWTENLIPKQWWGCSSSVRAWIREHSFQLPRLFAIWLSKEWPSLAAAGLVRAHIWEPEVEGAPAIVVGRWRSLQALADVFDMLSAWAASAYPGSVAT
jgi:hypothetical protein